MEIVVLKMLFIGSVSAQFGKHVYVPQPSLWPTAQKYCRDHYTDLSPITSRQEEMKLKNATFGKVEKFWIGLYRNENRKWLWSGGGPATYTPWDVDEPDYQANQIYTSVCWNGCRWNGWHNYASSYKPLPFFCFNLILMEYKMSWEQAMWHCNQKHTTLTSLASETEHLLALRKIKHGRITERVWIGLRYLGDRWLWVNDDPLVYQAWPQGGDQDHECPIWKHCGALNKGGLWENWDCQERLNFICY